MYYQFFKKNLTSGCVWQDRYSANFKRQLVAQGLIQKEEVYIDCEKSDQISTLANKIVTQ